MRLIFPYLPIFILISCSPEAEKTHVSTCLSAPQKHVAIDAARTIIGSDTAYPEERSRTVNLSAYDIDTTEITNRQFRTFVDATGYVTTAEKPQAGAGTPGGAVFKEPTSTNPNWWQFVEGASWKHPEGPTSNILGKDNYTVVQV